jgi:hypothetical protein
MRGVAQPNSLPGVNTPQFRTLLIRKLANMYPVHGVEFGDNHKAGLRFRLVASDGKAASDWHAINGNHDDSLQSRRLRGLLSANVQDTE